MAEHQNNNSTNKNINVQEDTLNDNFTTESLFAASAQHRPTNETEERDLPDAVWLMAVAHAISQETGVSVGEAAETVCDNQQLALQLRGEDFSLFEVAEHAASARMH